MLQKKSTEYTYLKEQLFVCFFSIVWPLGNVVQQKLNGESWETIDWVKVVRFGMYGTLVTAPLLYSWVRLTTVMFE